MIKFCVCVLFFLSPQIAGRTRAGYTSITKQNQILNHHNDDTDIENVTEVCTGSASNVSIANDYIPNAPNPIVYNIYGYQYSNLRTFFYHAIAIILLGIPYLISHLYQPFYVWLKLKKSDLNVCHLVFGAYTMLWARFFWFLFVYFF